MQRAHVVSVLFVLGVGAMAIVTRSLWFAVSTSRWDTPDLVFCRDRYRAAHTLVDSMRVDGAVRADNGKPVTGLTCGGLRDDYPEFFGVAAARR